MDINTTEIKILKLITNCKDELFAINRLHSKININRFYNSINSRKLVKYSLRSRQIVSIDNRQSITVLNETFRLIIDYYTELFNICNMFYTENKDNKMHINIQLNNDFYDISCEVLFLLFEYSYIYYFIWKILKNRPQDNDFYDILYKEHIKGIEHNSEIKTALDNYSEPFNEELLIHLWISYNFNDKIFNYKKYFNIMNNNKIIDKQLNTIQIITQQIEEFKFDNLDSTITYIKLLFKTCSQLKYNQLYDYITIPQYNEDCWFISMLTCMCYSDKSKNLILNKLEINKDSILQSIESVKTVVSTKEDIDNQFITFIYYIILNITHNHATYSAFENFNKPKLCEIAEYLQTYPVKYLNDMFTLYKSNYPRTDDMFQSICNGTIFWLSTFIDDGPCCNPSESGCNNIAHSIITSFYSILNIKTLYIYHYKHYDKYYIPSSITDDINTFDILIVAKNFNLNYKNLDISNFRDITIDYNNCINDYEIDYVIQGNEAKLSYNENAHDISCITYNGIEYIHDSSTIFDNIKCTSNTYTKPCTLISAKWKSFITKIQFTYLIRPCYFKEFNDIYEDEPIMEQYISSNKDINEYNILFVSNIDIIIAYVKTTSAKLVPTINSLIPDIQQNLNK